MAFWKMARVWVGAFGCQDQDGNTALFFAMQAPISDNGEDPRKATALALLKRGAHVDARNKWGDTPLVASQGSLRSLLVKYGADERALQMFFRKNE